MKHSKRNNAKGLKNFEAAMMFSSMAKSSPTLAKWVAQNYGNKDIVKQFQAMANSKSRKNANADIGPLTGVFDSAMYSSAPLSMPFQLAVDSQYNPITLNRILLSYCYMTFGVIQTVVDQPVEDGFRGGIQKLICDELDDDDKKALLRWIDKAMVIQRVKAAMKWAKLFGGAGLIINNYQDPAKELDKDMIRPGTDLSFLDADRWELVLTYVPQEEIETPYNYYSKPIHKSRVIKILGKEAPSFIRPRLQGWGMSEVDRLIRDANMYSKEQDVIYELIDEAKIDIWKIDGFNTNILSGIAQGKTSNRLQIATNLKNYHNAIVMDKEDEYEQKQISFSGLAEVLNQIRIGMSAAARMPMTKLFGLSASGFNSGEDDIENYNSLIESEVRAKAREVLGVVLPLGCRYLFGFEPEHIDFEFKPLRVLSAEQEESVKTSKQNRIFQVYDKRLFNAFECDEALRQENLITIDTEVSRGEVEPERPEDLFAEPKPGEEGKEGADGKEGKKAVKPKEGKS